MNHHYLICTRAVENGQFVAEPGKVRFLKAKDVNGVWPSPTDEIPTKAWVDEVRDLADGIADSRVCEGGDVLIFIHGYNNTLETVTKRQRYLNRDLAAEGFAHHFVLRSARDTGPVADHLEIASLPRLELA